MGTGEDRWNRWSVTTISEDRWNGWRWTVKTGEIGDGERWRRWNWPVKTVKVTGEDGETDRWRLWRPVQTVKVIREDRWKRWRWLIMTGNQYHSTVTVAPLVNGEFRRCQCQILVRWFEKSGFCFDIDLWWIECSIGTDRWQCTCYGLGVAWEFRVREIDLSAIHSDFQLVLKDEEWFRDGAFNIVICRWYSYETDVTLVLCYRFLFVVKWLAFGISITRGNPRLSSFILLQEGFGE